jgi:hypothetical protein
MLEIVRGADDLPHILHDKDFGKFPRDSRDAVCDGYLILDDVFVKEAKSGKNAVATVGRNALVVFEIEKIILDFFRGHLIRGLIIESGDPCNSSQIRPLSVRRKVPKFHCPDHFLA